MVVVLPLLIPTFDPTTVLLVAVPVPMGVSGVPTDWHLLALGYDHCHGDDCGGSVTKLEFNYDLSSLRRSEMAWSGTFEQEQQLAQSYSRGDLSIKKDARRCPPSH